MILNGQYFAKRIISRITENIGDIKPSYVDDTTDEISKKYENDEFYEYANSCNFEFTNDEIKVISEILTRTDIEKDHLTDSLMFGRAAYLKAMYDKYRLALARNETKGKPIKDHFAYFKKMLEKETYIDKKGKIKRAENNGD